MTSETATLGVDALVSGGVYDDLKGVTMSGYSGGNVPHPTYEQVCGKRTGHAEVVQVTFEPEVISFRDVLRVFFAIHDPTTKDRQGNDVGPQYRSVIFYHGQEQKAAAEEVIAELTREGLWPRPIVTEVTPFEAFYPAEDYHQDYFARNPYQGYCQAIIAPKVAKFRKMFVERLKAAGAP
jgi:peptide-methionine (S)-S-oxide reductase